MIKIGPNYQNKNNYKPNFSGNLILNTSEGLTSTLMNATFMKALELFGERVRTQTSKSLDIFVSHKAQREGMYIPIRFVTDNNGVQVCPYDSKWEDLELKFVDKSVNVDNRSGFCLNPFKDAKTNAEYLWETLQKKAAKCINQN